MLLEEGCGKAISPILLSLKLVETFNFMERDVFYVKYQDISNRSWLLEMA
jgi:hypothetical protein